MTTSTPLFSTEAGVSGRRFPFRPEMVLIDVDGTLVDSVPDLAYCVDAMLDGLGMSHRGEAEVRNWVGNGVERLVRRALVGALEGEPDETLMQKAYPIFLALYQQNTSGRSALYPGVREGLETLRERDYPLGCVTNKAARFTEPLLRDMGIRDYFDIVVSGDSLPRKKPDPMPLLHAAGHFGAAPSGSLMVGDSVSDVKAARAAGFSIACMTYGYNHGQDIRDARPDAVLDSMVELADLLES